ncbi:MAG: oxidoreductase family protein [Cytophagaceae bacterium]
MDEHLQSLLKSFTGANAIHEIGLIQNLWSDYGQIVRYGLKGSSAESVIVKHVLFRVPENHPRGWNSGHSHQRKLRSYQVETYWYKKYSSLCDENCRIPKCLGAEIREDEMLLVLEDLDAAGCPVRKTHLSWPEIKTCLSWLANFHATFLQKEPEGLWETGTYWHLETRQEEWVVLEDSNLKTFAGRIDQKLKETKFRTLVHGDAKLANFCFSEDGKKVAAVDFQYVGAGCGMKDVAYFIGSCLNEKDSEAMEAEILHSYFAELKNAVISKGLTIDHQSLEEDWRNLYHMAWADFHRFLKGWSPGHWKINSYSERISREVVLKLQNEKA